MALTGAIVTPHTGFGCGFLGVDALRNPLVEMESTPDPIRTGDLQPTKAALFQLSYGGKSGTAAPTTARTGDSPSKEATAGLLFSAPMPVSMGYGGKLSSFHFDTLLDHNCY